MAWRGLLLALLGRQAPDLRGDLIFQPWACRLLEDLQPLVAPDTLRGQKNRAFRLAAANSILSRLGGALNRNARELPGTQTILRGRCRFHDIGIGYRIGKGASVDALLSDGFRGTRRPGHLAADLPVGRGVSPSR